MDKKDMRQLLEMSITAGQKQAKAAEVSLLRSVVAALVEQLPTTAEPTPTAPIKAPQWVADWDDMIRARLASLQSDQVDTPSGPVRRNSECVHNWHLYANQPQTYWCNQCGALRQLGRIAVPAAAPTFSTSARGASSRFVENSVEDSAKLPSRPTNFDEVCRVAVLQDSHCILKVGHEGQHMDIFGEHPAEPKTRMGYN